MDRLTGGASIVALVSFSRFWNVSLSDRWVFSHLVWTNISVEDKTESRPLRGDGRCSANGS